MPLQPQSIRSAVFDHTIFTDIRVCSAACLLAWIKITGFHNTNLFIRFWHLLCAVEVLRWSFRLVLLSVCDLQDHHHCFYRTFEPSSWQQSFAPQSAVESSDHRNTTAFVELHCPVGERCAADCIFFVSSYPFDLAPRLWTLDRKSTPFFCCKTLIWNS